MIIATGIFLSSCKNNNLAPDVSKIPVVLSTERYEKDFFSLDSATLQEGLKKLTAKYPAFQNNFIYTILNVSFPNVGEAPLLLFSLDLEGICVSGGSACSSGANAGSHVLNALNVPSDRVNIRFSFSKFNTIEELDIVLEKLKTTFSS